LSSGIEKYAKNINVASVNETIYVNLIHSRFVGLDVVKQLDLGDPKPMKIARLPEILKPKKPLNLNSTITDYFSKVPEKSLNTTDSDISAYVKEVRDKLSRVEVDMSRLDDSVFEDDERVQKSAKREVLEILKVPVKSTPVQESKTSPEKPKALHESPKSQLNEKFSALFGSNMKKRLSSFEMPQKSKIPRIESTIEDEEIKNLEDSVLDFQTPPVRPRNHEFPKYQERSPALEIRGNSPDLFATQEFQNYQKSPEKIEEMQQIDLLNTQQIFDDPEPWEAEVKPIVPPVTRSTQIDEDCISQLKERCIIKEKFSNLSLETAIKQWDLMRPVYFQRVVMPESVRGDPSFQLRFNRVEDVRFGSEEVVEKSNQKKDQESNDIEDPRVEKMANPESSSKILAPKKEIEEAPAKQEVPERARSIPSIEKFHEKLQSSEKPFLKNEADIKTPLKKPKGQETPEIVQIPKLPVEKIQEKLEFSEIEFKTPPKTPVDQKVLENSGITAPKISEIPQIVEPSESPEKTVENREKGLTTPEEIFKTPKPPVSSNFQLNNMDVQKFLPKRENFSFKTPIIANRSSSVFTNDPRYHDLFADNSKKCFETPKNVVQTPVISSNFYRIVHQPIVEEKEDLMSQHPLERIYQVKLSAYLFSIEIRTHSLFQKSRFYLTS
jgi:hypothetical protein